MVLLPSLALAEEDGQSEDQTTAIVEADSLGEADFDTEQDIAVESNANSSNEYGFEYPETPENGRLIEMVTEKDGKKFYYFVSIEDVDYEVKVEKGLPIKLVFNDGREATFYRRKTFFKDVEIYDQLVKKYVKQLFLTKYMYNILIVLILLIRNHDLYLIPRI